MAPRKHSSADVPAPVQKPKGTDVAMMSTSREVFLGVVTPALSDLGAGTRLEGILVEDVRSDGEVHHRWDHLQPVVRAFYARLGVDYPVNPDAKTVAAYATDESVEPLTAEPMSATPLPPDPGELSLSEDEAEENTVGDEEHDVDTPEDDAASEEEMCDSPASRVDSESHARLQAEGAGADFNRSARMLYDDVIWLFGINDGEGALISLERLLTIGQIDEEVSEFLELNGVKLLGLYEGYIGPFDKVPMRGDTTPDAMPDGYLSQGELDRIFSMVDGKRTIADLIDASDRTPLETCASIEQLHRARLLEL